MSKYLRLESTWDDCGIVKTLVGVEIVNAFPSGGSMLGLPLSIRIIILIGISKQWLFEISVL